MEKCVLCPSCDGKGSFPCTDCACRGCQGSGQIKVACTVCQSGKISCQRCGATGQVVVKRTWFSEKYGTCSSCMGTGTLKCSQCGGKAVISQTCSVCSGKGSQSSCGRCHGTRKYGCSKCVGSGRIVSDWFKSLDQLPIERLKFEYEKRQREVASAERKVGSFQTQISRISHELDEMYEWYERDCLERPGAYNAAGTEPAGLHDFPREINRLQGEISDKEAQIRDLEDEMGAIEEVMDRKWTRGASG